MMNAALRKTCSSASGKRGFHPCFCLRLVLGIPSESGSARLGHIPSLPWKSQLPLKPYLSLQPFIFKGNCDSFDSLLDFCLISLNSFYLLRKCGLLAHTSAAFLKNCCTEKLFSCLRLVLGTPLKSGSARLGHIPSLPWESQLPLKSCPIITTSRF